MAYLVIDLQKSALEDNISTVTLLRKAFLVAKKLKLNKFEEWINFELNGYKSVEDIPEYRKVIGQVKGLNPYRGWIPTMIENSELEDMISRRDVIESISKLEYLMDNEEGSLCITFPAEAENTLGIMFGFKTKYNLFVDKSQFKGILETVRTIILNWALELEADGILGEEMLFTSEEKEKAENSNYTVNNFYGNIENSQIQQNTSESQQNN